MNQHWMRWSFASISKFLADRISPGLHVYVEGQDRDTNKYSDFCEIRIDGPYAKQRTRSEWTLDFEVNILIQSAKDERDFHKIHRLKGIVAAAFAACIPVYRYGDGPDDDPNILESELIARSDKREHLAISDFGQVQDDITLMQSTVECHYRGTYINQGA